MYPTSWRSSFRRSPTEADSARSSSRSMVDMNRETALIAAAPRPGTSSGASATSHTGSPTVFAWETMRACEVWPIPRRGELTARSKATTSLGLTSSVR